MCRSIICVPGNPRAASVPYQIVFFFSLVQLLNHQAIIMGAPAGSDATAMSIYLTIQGKTSLNYGKSSYPWSCFQFIANVKQELLIYICKAEAGPTASQRCSCVQDTEIPAVPLRPGFAWGRQSWGTVTAWQRSDLGTTSRSLPVGLDCLRGRACPGYMVHTEGDPAYLGVHSSVCVIWGLLAQKVMG